MSLLVLLSACGRTASGASDRGQAAVSEQARRAQAIRAETLDLAERIWQAEDLLDQRCMQRLGFTVHPRRSKQEHADLNPYPASPTVEQARRYGYQGGPPRDPADKDLVRDAFPQLPAAEQTRYLTALDGGSSITTGIEIVLDDGRRRYIPDKGCRGETLRLLFGDVRAVAELNLSVEHGVVRAQRATDADERVVTVLRRWAECMSAEGHGEFGTPEAARGATESYQHTFGEAEGRAKERAVATAHATCAARVDLDKVRRTVWESQLVADQVTNETQLVALRQAQLAALTRAQTALGNG
jgi:hypothetical protein